MALSIKDPETERLVRTLAERRRTGVTGAIKLAVDNELKRDEVDHEAKIDRMRAAVKDIQAQVKAMGGLPSMKEMDEWLYDENGLPH